jgi:hypothetical protein
MKRIAVLSFFLMILCTSQIASAGHPLITDDTGTYGKGVFNTELFFEFERDKSDGVTTEVIELATVLSYGLAESVDLMLTIPYLHVRAKEMGESVSENGLSDVAIELKWRFLEFDDLSFAVRPGITLPTGDEDRGLGTGKTTGSLFMIATKAFDPWALHANLGYTRNENKFDERTDLLHASIAAEVEVADGLLLVADTGIETNPEKGAGKHPIYALAGVIYALTDKTVVDLGIKFGLNEVAPDYALLAGISYTF